MLLNLLKSDAGCVILTAIVLHVLDEGDSEYCGLNVDSGTIAEEQVAIIEKWSAEHPRKTKQSVFLEQYPNSLIDDEGILEINPCHINKNFNRFFSKNYCETSCTICRRNYWRKEVE